jgi:very-short-patch-repair endonuclease
MTRRIHNRLLLKGRRRELRNSLTPAEAKLWSLLKNAQLEGRKFRRQHSAGPYILDFYCPAEKLCIEVDGLSHYTDVGPEYDAERTEFLRSLNIRVIRFDNRAVHENLEGVVEEIRQHFLGSDDSGG